MEREMNEKFTMKDLKLCQNVIHDMEDKLEHAYLDEDIPEMKRCENALKTLDKEYFELKAKLSKKLALGKNIIKHNKHEKELEKDMRYCETVMRDIEEKLEVAYLNEDLNSIKRCEDALRTLENEFFIIKKEIFDN